MSYNSGTLNICNRAYLSSATYQFFFFFFKKAFLAFHSITDLHTMTAGNVQTSDNVHQDLSDAHDFKAPLFRQQDSLAVNAHNKQPFMTTSMHH